MLFDDDDGVAVVAVPRSQKSSYGRRHLAIMMLTSYCRGRCYRQIRYQVRFSSMHEHACLRKELLVCTEEEVGFGDMKGKEIRLLVFITTRYA